MWKNTPFEKCLQKTKVPHKLPKKEYLESGKFPVVSQEATLISGYHNEQTHVFNVSKPVVIFGDHTQVLKYVDFDFVVGADGVKILLPIEGVDTKYFYYLLQALMPKGKGYARHYRLLKELNISYPPLAEQQRIVAKLDAAFAEIDAAIEVANAKEAEVQKLEGSLLSSSLGGNAMMWKTVKLDEIVSLSMGKTPSRGNAKFWDKEKISKNIWLSIADLSALGGLYIEDSKEYVSDEGAKLFKTVPSETLVMSFKLSIGKLAITKCELRTNEAIAALPIKDEKLITKEYLYYFLSSIDWDALAGNDVKVKGKTLNKAKLKEIPISYPPLAEQQRIVAKLDAASSEFKNANESIIKCKANYLALKSAILAQELQSEAA